MPGWREKGIKRVEFDKDGFEGWWARVIRGSYLTPAELDRLPRPKEGEEPTMVDMAKIVETVVLEWNLIAPDSDDPLALPKDDPKWMEKVPLAVLNRIIAVAAEGMEESFRTGGKVA